MVSDVVVVSAISVSSSSSTGVVAATARLPLPLPAGFSAGAFSAGASPRTSFSTAAATLPAARRVVAVFFGSGLVTFDAAVAFAAAPLFFGGMMADVVVFLEFSLRGLPMLAAAVEVDDDDDDDVRAIPPSPSSESESTSSSS